MVAIDFARIDVPDFDFAFLRREASGGGEELAVGREGHGPHLLGFSVESGDRLAGGGVDESDGFEGSGREEFAVGTVRQRADLGMDWLARRMQ